MTLSEHGRRFCLSPDGKRARWCDPIEIPYFYADWIDVTDWTDEEFAAVIELLNPEESKT